MAVKNITRAMVKDLVKICKDMGVKEMTFSLPAGGMVKISMQDHPVQVAMASSSVSEEVDKLINQPIDNNYIDSLPGFKTYPRPED